jgi:hypothetical protein
MGEHRSQIGAVLLASVAVFGAAGGTTAATNADGWGNPAVFGLFAFALLCLVGSLFAFRPVRSGNAAMNQLIRRAFRKFKRRRTLRRLLRRSDGVDTGPRSKEEELTLTTEPPPLETPLSPDDRQRIARETAERLAEGALDPPLRSFDKRNKGEAGAESSDPPKWSPPPLPSERPGAHLRRAIGEANEQREQRKYAIERGTDLANRIKQVHMRMTLTGFTIAGAIVLDELTAQVETWADDAGITKPPPQAKGRPTPTGADFARLKDYVEEQLRELRANQSRSES